ncbi:glycosyltransferase family 2 protein [Candidatus Magnetomonas plexicatena]|uniref:glycosyltransferase family 2 protein n=1 Tax=Candidatus Magnetomonas plexicatena TaxID=2552947 RepID=UPI001100B49A|nr:glycosyltransferase [Nitrospirales bacterium LBB_01]
MKNIFFDKIKQALYGRVLKPLKRKLFQKKSHVFIKQNDYDKWIQPNEPPNNKTTAKKLSDFKYKPLIAVVVVSDSDSELIRMQILESYSNCNFYFITEIAVTDTILKLSDEDYIFYIGLNCITVPLALNAYIDAINETPDVDFIFSDNDYISREKNKRFCPVFKPSSLESETLCSFNYVGDVWVIRREFLRSFTLSDAGCLSYAVSLYVCRMRGLSRRIPKMLYHVVVEKEDESAIRFSHDCTNILTSYIKNTTDMEFSVTEVNSHGMYSVNYVLKSTPLVSIIIPNKDSAVLLKKCIDSIYTKSTYRNYEIVIAENGSDGRETFSLYKKLKLNTNRLKVITIPGAFNYSAVNNRAVKECCGEVLVFLNNDTEVITPEWIEKLLCHAQKHDTGAVGAKLYYSDGTIQHAGVVLGFGGIAGDPYQGIDGKSDGYLYALRIVRNVSAVTGACLMVRRELFDQINGFDENLSIAYNDVDLCLRLNALGLNTVWTPECELYHYESKSRGYEITGEKRHRLKKESDIFRSRWESSLKKMRFSLV